MIHNDVKESFYKLHVYYVYHKLESGSNIFFCILSVYKIYMIIYF